LWFDSPSGQSEQSTGYAIVLCPTNGFLVASGFYSQWFYSVIVVVLRILWWSLNIFRRVHFVGQMELLI